MQQHEKRQTCSRGNCNERLNECIKLERRIQEKVRVNGKRARERERQKIAYYIYLLLAQHAFREWWSRKKPYNEMSCVANSISLSTFLLVSMLVCACVCNVYACTEQECHFNFGKVFSLRLRLWLDDTIYSEKQFEYCSIYIYTYYAYILCALRKSVCFGMLPPMT